MNRLLAWERTVSAAGLCLTARAGDCRLEVTRQRWRWRWRWRTWRDAATGPVLLAQGSSWNLEVARRLAVEAAVAAAGPEQASVLAEKGGAPGAGPAPAAVAAPSCRRVGGRAVPLLLGGVLLLAGATVLARLVPALLAPPVVANVVGVEVRVGDEVGTGTALAVDPPLGADAAAAWFVTARHVVMVNGQVAAPAELSVRVPGVSRTFPVQSVTVARDLDVALLEVRGLTTDPLPPATWVDVAMTSWAEVQCVPMADWTYWTYQAFGVSYTAPAQESQGLEGTTFTTDSVPVPGCSGGPVVIQRRGGQYLAGMLTAVWITRGYGPVPGVALGAYEPDHIVVITADQIEAFVRTAPVGRR